MWKATRCTDRAPLPGGETARLLAGGRPSCLRAGGRSLLLRDGGRPLLLRAGGRPLLLRDGGRPRGRAHRAALWALCGVLAWAGLACVPAEAPPPEVPPTPAAGGPPVEFGYMTATGGPLTSTELRGRFTVLALVATYDLASQAQIKVLGLVAKNHTPRVNVAAIAMEPAENAPLVAAFAQGLGVPFPVAIADARTLAGHGPFEGLRHVPSIVILDREGREVYRHVGAMDEKPIHEELERLGARR